MPEYTVNISGTFYFDMKVTAEDEVEAKELIKEEIETLGMENDIDLEIKEYEVSKVGE